MPGTVSGTQVSAFSSPTNGTSGDADEVRGNDNTIRAAHNTHDADATIHVQSSAIGSRPAAGTAGRVWVTTDSSVPRFWYDNGSTWLEADYLNKTQGGTVAGATTFSAAVTPAGGVTGDVILNDAAALIIGGSTSTTFRNNADSANNVVIADNGLVTVERQAVVAPEFRATADPGVGQLGAVTFTAFDDRGSINSSGVGSIKFKDGTSRDSVGFVRIYLGTTPYYVPYFAAGG
jgi:hypothetical protein